MAKYNYYVYITTNSNKTTLYIGVTNNLARRLQEHYEDRDDQSSFAGKYYCYNLVYCEVSESVIDAISREKGIRNGEEKKRTG